MSSIFSTPWKDISTTFARQLREPCKKLIDRVSNFKNRMENQELFLSMLKRDKDWQGFASAYYGGVALLGDAMTTAGNLLPHGGVEKILNGYGTAFITVGAGAIVLGGMRQFFMDRHAEKILENRSEIGLFTSSYKSKHFHDPSAMEYGFDKIDTFSKHLRKAEESLELLKAARKIKRMKPYYQHCDKISDETHAVKYSRFEQDHVIGFDKISENLKKAAQAGLENLDVAYKSLTELPESSLRTKKIEQFLSMAKQFEPETRMLPQSEVSDKSIWSDIQALVKKGEALQCQTTNPASTASTNNVIHSQRLKHR